MQNTINIFDKKQTRRNRTRAMLNDEKADFLLRWTANELQDRLDLIRKKFDRILQIGGATPKIYDHALVMDDVMDVVMDDIAIPHSSLLGDAEYLPFCPNAFDLIISSFSLHHLNDLPGALIQINQSLKPDGLLIGAFLGGDTLKEFKECIQTAELEITGGLAPRTHPMIDIKQMGALMQRAGYALPVIDSEILTVEYQDIYALMRDLRNMGENNALNQRHQKFTSRNIFARADAIYTDRFTNGNGRIDATFEIIFISGWKPHESQQKPLKPGSAENSLFDILNKEPPK